MDQHGSTCWTHEAPHVHHFGSPGNPQQRGLHLLAVGSHGLPGVFWFFFQAFERIKTANLPAPEKKKFHFSWCQWDMRRALLGVNVDCAIHAAVVMVVSRSWSCLNLFLISFKAQSIRISSLSRLAQTYRHCHVVWLSLPFVLTPGFCGSGGLVSHLQAVGRFNMLSWICEAWTNCSPGIDPKTSWSISIYIKGKTQQETLIFTDFKSGFHDVVDPSRFKVLAKKFGFPLSWLIRILSLPPSHPSIFRIVRHLQDFLHHQLISRPPQRITHRGEVDGARPKKGGGWWRVYNTHQYTTTWKLHHLMG